MHTDDSCVFCRIASHQIPADILYEDDSVVAFLSIEPTSSGHTVVVPREHSERLDKATPEAASHLLEAVRKLGPCIQAATEADGYNIGINTGTAAGQIVMHTHVHIIPRRSDDGLVAWAHHPSSAGERAKVAAAIRAAL